MTRDILDDHISDVAILLSHTRLNFVPHHPCYSPARKKCLYLTRRAQTFFDSFYSYIMATNITFHPGSVTHEERATFTKQKGITIWLTGLSASGKSTIAVALEQHLLHLGLNAYRLDGDNIRFGLNSDLGFDEKARNENIRRIAEVAKLFTDNTTITITSFISPYKKDRDSARALHAAAGLPFIEVYVDVSVETAEKRDPKGLYKKAREGIIKEFTGISAPYEAPEKAEITIDNTDISVEEGVRQIMTYLESNNLISTKA